MIYMATSLEDALDQGDLIDGCPILGITAFDLADLANADLKITLYRVILVTQTCDLASEKSSVGTVATVFDAQAMIDDGALKPADVKGPIRGGRTWGLYFLPAQADLGLGEMIVDLRRLHTVRLDLLRELCRAGKRNGSRPAAVPRAPRQAFRRHVQSHWLATAV